MQCVVYRIATQNVIGDSWKIASLSVQATGCIQTSLILIDISDCSPTVCDKLNRGGTNWRTVCDKSNRGGSLYGPSAIIDYHRQLKGEPSAILYYHIWFFKFEPSGMCFFKWNQNPVAEFHKLAVKHRYMLEDYIQLHTYVHLHLESKHQPRNEFTQGLEGNWQLQSKHHLRSP
jgi:hypothetical protein